ncbi:general transcription factor 3C polypeptide 4 isoform X1 [Schistocerca nitens]|uniref:general transcription factor 3C polypeptide 4 isoform X1 n=2 Tax=Schistocerca nitens TaxID=7011 RepID=UPI002117B824|nr:general transcription factor 3C polypeptide 4 isoform X1 [Schistocerca nitens]
MALINENGELFGLQETMELKEINTIAFAPGVTSHFAVSWSEDNKMSLVTSKGIHIFEFIPNPRNSKCWLSSRRFWLKIPDIRPTRESGVDTNKLVWKVPQPCVYEMIMDANLTPDLVYTKPLPPHVIQASWSPAGMLRHQRCLLAVVLNTGAILLFGPRTWKWLVVCNLSEIWLKHCRELWEEMEPAETVAEQYDQLKRRTASLKMNMITWGQLKQDSCRFAVTHTDASISVWEIAVMNKAQWDAASVQLIRVVDTKMSLPSALLCLSIGTVVGDLDGHISVLPDVFKDVPAETTMPYVLWDEEDHIKVNAISSLPQSSECESTGKWIILAVKKTFMIVFVLNKNGQKISEYLHRVGGLAISGLVPISAEGVVVTSHTGSVCKLNIKVNESEDVIVESENIVTNFKTKDVAFYGIACSRNQAVWAVVTSICKLYDHLVLRKPGQVIFCSYIPEDNLSSCLANNAAKPLIDTGEYLELIRMNCLKNKAVPLLQNLPCATKPFPWDIPKLRVEFWLAHTKLVLLPNSGEEDKEQQMKLTQKYITELEQLLQVLHAITALKSLKFTAREKPLNMHEQISAHLMDTWLRIYASAASDSIADLINEALADPLPVTNEVLEEKCAICNQECPMTADYQISKCSNGHKLTRCSQSLRQCMLPPYFLCPTPGCCAVAHKDCAILGKPILCIYCSAILQLDERVGGERKPVPAIYQIKPDPTNVRTESTKVCSDKSANKSRNYIVSDEFIEKHTYIIQVKDRSKKNVNDKESAKISKK